MAAITKTHSFEGRPVRVVSLGGQHWFVAKDVKPILFNTNEIPSAAWKQINPKDIARVERGRCIVQGLFTDPKTRHFNLLTFQAVASLCIDSEAEWASEFRHWADRIDKPWFWKEWDAQQAEECDCEATAIDGSLNDSQTLDERGSNGDAVTDLKEGTFSVFIDLSNIEPGQAVEIRIRGGGSANVGSGPRSDHQAIKVN